MGLVLSGVAGCCVKRRKYVTGLYLALGVAGLVVCGLCLVGGYHHDRATVYSSVCNCLVIRELSISASVDMHLKFIIKLKQAAFCEISQSGF